MKKYMSRYKNTYLLQLLMILLFVPSCRDDRLGFFDEDFRDGVTTVSLDDFLTILKLCSDTC